MASVLIAAQAALQLLSNIMSQYNSGTMTEAQAIAAFQAMANAYDAALKAWNESAS